METYDAWLRVPFIIALYNPRTGAASRHVLLAGGVAARHVRDGNARVDWYERNPGKLLHSEGLVVDGNVALYPEDNLMEMREKIYVATGVPVYRQHVWMADDAGKSNGAVKTTYSVFTDAPVAINITRIDGAGAVGSGVVSSLDPVPGAVADTAAVTERIAGLPIDRSLYTARDYIHITAGDTFSLISTWAPTGGIIWVADIASWTEPIATQLSAMINDKYMLEVIYWGFVAKYWPMMTQEVFAVFAAGESGLRAAFPAVARSLTELRRKYEAERKIVYDRYSLAHKARTMKRTISITQFTASVTSLSVHINVRNIFESFSVSDSVPQITAYVDAGEGRRVRLVRSKYDAPTAESPNTPAFTNGLVFALVRASGAPVRTITGGAISPHTGDYLWLAIHPNGKYYIRGTWHEDAGIDFADIYAILERYVAPQIAKINTLGRLAFNTGTSLELVARETVSFSGLNVSIAWKESMAAPSFRILRASWDEMAAADIAVIRPSVLHDRFDLTYRKGIYAHDPAKIDAVVSMSGGDLRNQYSYLSSPLVAKKWQQNYGGRTCSISMRESDVRIDVVDIREDEFRGVFLDYMFTHLWTVTHSAEYKNAAPAGAVGRPVRRLRDADPKLFNLSRYGVSRKYSQICQGPHQPIIVDDSTPARIARNAVRYWNFTHDRPAQYACPNPKYPHLSFITKTHPAGYCLPCCNKRQPHGDAYSGCLRNRTWTSTDDSSEHVLAYGKAIPAGRYSYPHPGVISIMPGALLAYVDDGQTSIAALGPSKPTTPTPTTPAGSSKLTTPAPTAPAPGSRGKAAQHAPIRATVLASATATTSLTSEWRIIHALATALELPSSTVITKLANVISASFASFGPAIVAGRDRAALLAEFTNGPRAAGVDWIEIIAYAAGIAYDTGIIVFDDTYDTLRVRVPQSTIDASNEKYVLVSISAAHVYPIVRDADDADDYQRVFGAADRPVAQILAAATRTSTRYADLAAVRRVVGWKITRKYVNLQNMCYAVLVTREADGKHAYIAVTYSAHGADGVPINTTGWSVADESIEAATTIAFLVDLAGADDHVRVIGRAVWPAGSGTGSAGSGTGSGKPTTPMPTTPMPTTPMPTTPMPTTPTPTTTAGAIVVHADGATMYNYYNKATDTDLPLIELDYDPTSLTRAMLTRADAAVTDDAESERVGREQYRMTIYNALVMHIGEYMRAERNTDMRQRIIAMARTPERMAELGLSATDLGVVRATLQFAGIKGLTKRLGTSFDFDMMSLAAIQSADSREKALSILRDIVDRVATVGAASTQPLPNVYTLCSVKPDQPFCARDGRLSVEDMDNLLLILCDALRNPLRAATIFGDAWNNNVIDRMSFTKYGNDRIVAQEV